MAPNKKNKAKATREAGKVEESRNTNIETSPTMVGNSRSAAKHPTDALQVDRSLNNPTAAESSTTIRSPLVEDTIAEETSVVPRAGKDGVHNDTLSSEGSPSIPEWARKALSHIGYFNPDHPAPSGTVDPIRNEDRKYIYWDVFRYIERLSAVSATMEKENFTKILQFLPHSFLETASTWYNEELDELTRDLLLSEDTDIETWYAALTKRFGKDGHRLAESSTPTGIVAELGGRRKSKAEKPAFWDPRKGETHIEWQMRLRKNP